MHPPAAGAPGMLTALDVTRARQSPMKMAETRDWSTEMAAISRTRDRASFMRIYDHFAPRVQRYLCGLGSDATAAEDLTQEALLRLWQRSDGYDPSRGSLATWIYRIARNLYIDRIRREPMRSAVHSDLSQIEDMAGDVLAPAPESFVEGINLRQVLARLPAEQARMIRMAYLEARTHQEIADELNMPLGTVKSCVRRTFIKLQREMRGET